MIMIARVLLAVIGVTAVFSANAGDVYKCKGADGVPIFQNTPCSTPSAQLRHDRYQVREPNTKESAASSQRAVDALLKRHPDIAYGSNQQLLKTAIAELSRPGMSSWYILDLAYTRAHNAPDWAHQPIGQQPGTAYAGTGLLQDTTRDPSCGIGSSAYQCGKVHGFRCTKSNGEVYFAASCGTSRVKVGETITTTYDAFDPQTGRLIKGGLDQGHTPVYDTMTGAMLQPNDVRWQPNQTTRPVYRRVDDTAAAMDPDQACTNAQQQAETRPSKANNQRVYDLCHAGRSMYDLKPARGSLYSPDRP